MHINIHIAIGIIFTSVLHYFFKFNLFEYVFIMILSFICDFDIFFSKIAKNHNHRLFITHSIIPSIALIIVGFILIIYFNNYVIFLGGLSYLFHILIDTFDWGTNVFYFPKKQTGFKLLVSNEENKNIQYYLSQYKLPESYFDAKYYENKFCMGIEIIIFFSMLIVVILFAFEYFFLISIYFLGLGFHLSRHYHLKKLERD